MDNNEIIEIITSSSIEKENGRTRGLFLMSEACPNNLYKTTHSIHFTGESFILRFNTDTSIYQIVNRDSRCSTDLSKDDFLDHLYILIEMDRLGQERNRLRKLIHNKDIREYKRNRLIDDMINP